MDFFGDATGTIENVGIDTTVSAAGAIGTSSYTRVATGWCLLNRRRTNKRPPAAYFDEIVGREANKRPSATYLPRLLLEWGGFSGISGLRPLI